MAKCHNIPNMQTACKKINIFWFKGINKFWSGGISTVWIQKIAYGKTAISIKILEINQLYTNSFLCQPVPILSLCLLFSIYTNYLLPDWPNFVLLPSLSSASFT